MSDQITSKIPRDRTKLKKRDHVDLRSLNPESPEYWEEVLRRESLTMSRGRSRRLSYVGTGNDLVRQEEINLA